MIGKLIGIFLLVAAFLTFEAGNSRQILVSAILVCSSLNLFLRESSVPGLRRLAKFSLYAAGLLVLVLLFGLIF